MIVHNMEQRSDEWYAIRRGKFTASEFDTLMPSSRQAIDEFNETQMKIIYRVASERLTGASDGQKFTSQAMQWGIDTEAEARAAYEIATGNIVDQVGFIEYDEWTGCSPDGLVGDDLYLEIKCPNSDTHLSYFRNSGLLLSKYKWQLAGGLYISGRQKATIISYDPRYEREDMQMVMRDFELSPEVKMTLVSRLYFAVRECKGILGA